MVARSKPDWINGLGFGGKKSFLRRSKSAAKAVEDGPSRPMESTREGPRRISRMSPIKAWSREGTGLEAISGGKVVPEPA